VLEQVLWAGPGGAGRTGVGNYVIFKCRAWPMVLSLAPLRRAC
jgi:hypothetical protein